jgi:hypothetical protein
MLLASLTLCEAAMLMLLPPRGHGLVPVAIAWQPALYVSALVSLLASVVSARLGGPLPSLKTAAATPQPPEVRRDGRTLH